MLICGIKVSHDGAVAVIEGNRLLFSIEVEKLDNGLRYSSLGSPERVTQILESEGLDPAEVDQFVMDGWFVPGVDDIEARDPMVIANRGGGRLGIPVAPYQDRQDTANPLARYSFPDHAFGPAAGYVSYHHVTGHVLGGYCSSPFALRGADALVLTWDGGSFPRLYHVSARARTVTSIAAMLPITGDSFGEFSSQLDPFFTDTDEFSADQTMRHHLSVAGKAMAYAALGRIEESTFGVFDKVYAGFPAITADTSKAFGETITLQRYELLPGLSNADLIASYQAYLGNLLLQSLSGLLRSRLSEPRLASLLPADPRFRPNLVLAGGCALNIKWNSLLRDSELFQEIWIPPFPNDSGAAIGTASCEMFGQGGQIALDWDVYSGPRLAAGIPGDWQVRSCTEQQLAELLCTDAEPVVVLSGRAEIGPRALGNRSILAPATDPAMKGRLNAMKGRAEYRPVAPVCLASRAAEIFAPGCDDRYMLFEHRPRPGWADTIPAVLHLDGTARLQTIDPLASSSPAGRILACYARISGIPVLCNTSANFNGRGFFPDVASAARWGGARYIWSDGYLYTSPAPAARAGPADRTAAS
jgi:carbamoyltransferase